MRTFTARILPVAFFLLAFPLVLVATAAAESPVFTHLVESGKPHGAKGPKHKKPFFHPKGIEALDLAKKRTELAAPSGSLGSGAAGAPSSTLLGLDGVDEASGALDVDPPDGAIAVGPTHVVEAVNDTVRIWVKTYDVTGTLSGATVAVSAADLNTFFGNHPNCYTAANDFFGLVSDPSTDYDSAGDRFMLTMISFDQLFFTSSLCIAVSQTGDPTGFWTIYAFPISPFTSVLDFPRGVFSGDGQLYVTGNLVLCCDANGEPFFDHARAYAFRKGDLYAGINTNPQIVVVGNDPESGLPADSLTPAQGAGTAGMYFVSASNPSDPPLAASTVTLWKWRDPFGANVFTQQGHVAVSSYTQPPNAPQPGTTFLITTNDARNLTAYWFNNTVYAAHAIGCTQGAATVACVQWYQLGSLDGPPALLQEGIVADSTNPIRYRYFPSLAVDKNARVALAYSYSSTAEYAGLAYTTLSASGPLGSEAILKTGEGTFLSTRYGDYAGTALDPHDGLTIWHAGEYAKNFGGSTEWGTWVSAIQIAGVTGTPDFSIAAVPASPPAGAVLPGATQTYTVTVTALNGFSGAVDLTVSGLPAGATPQFSPSPVSPGATPATATLTITTTSATTGGTYVLTITGTAGGVVHATTVTLAVKDFALSVSPVSRTVKRGKSTSYTVTVTSLTGFTGTVTLGPVQGLPAGAPASFSRGTVTFTSGGATSARSTMTIKTVRSTLPGTYALTIRATSATGLIRTVGATLVVQ